MKPEMDPLLDEVLAEYSAVEPAPGQVAAWMQAARTASRRDRVRRSLRPRAAWFAMAAALLLAVALTAALLYRRARVQQRLRLAQHEHTVLVPMGGAGAPPLSARDKQLIQLMQTNPSALANQKPDAPPAKTPHR
ncbi:MAG TPA: hypothetical protein VN515_04050 [Terriglobales bacterium]|nr:hypothetical protein [Terriglobales bacterium]